MDIKIEWLGYCKETNKIWGWFKNPKPRRDLVSHTFALRRHYAFYGYVKNHIEIQMSKSVTYRTEDVIEKKIQNGFVKVDDLSDIWPTFDSDFQATLIVKFISQE